MIGFSGQVWRIVFQGQYPTLPARAPEGRFHHSGQSAVYTSLTPEGCGVAIKRYLKPSDPPRELVALHLSAHRLADRRGQQDLAVVWQEVRETGQPAPTWAHSDRARALGAQGMFYSSRSRPDLDHLVLFAAAPELELVVESRQPWHAAQTG